MAHHDTELAIKYLMIAGLSTTCKVGVWHTMKELAGKSLTVAGFFRSHWLKSQVVYSKQPKLGLTQEFVVDCAHALWVVHSIKRLVSFMLLKWFLSDSFIYFMYRMFNEIF